MYRVADLDARIIVTVSANSGQVAIRIQDAGILRAYTGEFMSPEAFSLG